MNFRAIEAEADMDVYHCHTVRDPEIPCPSFSTLQSDCWKVGNLSGAPHTALYQASLIFRLLGGGAGL